MSKNINKLLIGESTFNLRPYAICSTASSTTGKEVTLTESFELFDGASILVKFNNGNSATNPTLRVKCNTTNDASDTSAISIRCNGVALTATNRNWKAGAVIEFVYDGTYWNMMTTDNVNTDTNTTYSAGTNINISSDNTISAQTNYTKTALSNSATSLALSPNVYYTIAPSSNSNRTISFNSEISGVMNEYVIEIDCTNYAPSFSIPSGINWMGNSAPTLRKGYKYVFSIVDKLGVWVEF